MDHVRVCGRRGRAAPADGRPAPRRRRRPWQQLGSERELRWSGRMIEATGLSKRYGDTLAVDDLSFTVPPGQVTGFLGPNGAGKSTTMRMILGLDAPTSGAVTVGGRPYTGYRRPLFEVGTLLEAKAFHGGRTARNHLLCLA